MRPYICHDCKYVFVTPHKWNGETLEHFGTPCNEQYDGCPLCQSDDIYHTDRCSLCEQYITGEYVEVMNGEKYCQNCYDIKVF